jgi:hypothetical protein
VPKSAHRDNGERKPQALNVLSYDAEGGVSTDRFSNLKSFGQEVGHYASQLT